MNMVRLDDSGHMTESYKRPLTREGDKGGSNYSGFYDNAFTEEEIDEIVEQGGADSESNFKEVAKKVMHKRDYYDKMFPVRRDGQGSQFHRLGDAIYENYIRDLSDRRVRIREVKYVRKEKEYFVVWKTVAKGQTIQRNNKVYKGGQRLPKSFRLRR